MVLILANKERPKIRIKGETTGKVKGEIHAKSF